MGTPYTFGTYAYQPATDGASGSIITDAPKEYASRLRVAESPGSVEQFTQGGLPAPRRLTLSGHLFAKGSDALSDLWDDFVAAHDAGVPQLLYLDQDDRYLLAEVESVRDVNASKTMGSVAWEVGFLCQSPYWWLDTAVSATGTVASDHLSATIALAVGGNRPARAAVSLTISAIGTIPMGATYPLTTSAITITNTTTGATATVIWARSTTGTVVIDGVAEKITQNALDAQAIFLTGPWLSLKPGVTNNLSIACAGGAQITAASAACQGRIR